MRISTALLGIVSVAALGWASCTNSPTTSSADSSQSVDMVAEAKKLNDLVAQFDDTSQRFKVSSKKPSQLTGKKGTKISIRPDDLTTQSGAPLSAEIEVELKELTKQSDLLKANARTTSKGRQLVSGGAYYINMTSGGEQLRLKAGKTLAVNFPKLSDEEMSLFYGERDDMGEMNWEEAGSALVEQPDPPQVATGKKDVKAEESSQIDDIFEFVDTAFAPAPLSEETKEWLREEEIRVELYAALQLSDFGWINCDRFFDFPNKTDLFVRLSPPEGVNTANVYLIFQDINSIISSYFPGYTDRYGEDRFVRIPVGYPVRLVALAMREETVLSYVADFSVKENQVVNIALEETSMEEVKALFAD
jgi:hypothetical protein